MATLNTTNIKHGSSSINNIVLATDGGVKTSGFWENPATISNNYTVGANNNAMAAGPLTISATITVNSGSSLIIL
jgi:transcription termination factor Rho